MLERIYWFYHKIKASKYPSKKAFMERFEVSESTFKRDVAYLRDRLGAPIEYSRKRSGYYFSETGFEVPSFWFHRVHLIMLHGMCDQLIHMIDSCPGEILSLKEKIENLLRINEGRNIFELISFDNVEWVPFASATFETLIDAMLRKKCVSMIYHTGYSNQIKKRKVEPYRLHNYSGSWHLIGFCHLRKLPRVFLIGRILEIEVLEENFSTPMFDVKHFMDDSFGIFRGDTKRNVRLKFSPEIAPVVEMEVWHEQQKMVSFEDGSLQLELPVTSLLEITGKVLQYGSKVEVLEPAELRNQIAAESEKILKIYQPNTNITVHTP